MALLEQWHAIAYNENADRGQLQNFWATYFNLEKGARLFLLPHPPLLYPRQARTQEFP